MAAMETRHTFLFQGCQVLLVVSLCASRIREMPLSRYITCSDFDAY